jgi:hypothetical protein
MRAAEAGRTEAVGRGAAGGQSNALQSASSIGNGAVAGGARPLPRRRIITWGKRARRSHMALARLLLPLSPKGGEGWVRGACHRNKACAATPRDPPPRPAPRFVSYAITQGACGRGGWRTQENGWVRSAQANSLFRPRIPCFVRRIPWSASEQGIHGKKLISLRDRRSWGPATGEIGWNFRIFRVRFPVIRERPVAGLSHMSAEGLSSPLPLVGRGRGWGSRRCGTAVPRGTPPHPDPPPQGGREKRRPAICNSPCPGGPHHPTETPRPRDFRCGSPGSQAAPAPLRGSP